MRTLAERGDHRHMSFRALALYAQRIGHVVPSPSTGYRMAKKLTWRRPRRRLHPAKPKIAIRASTPGELLHVDVTIIRVRDGTGAYLHAAIEGQTPDEMDFGGGDAVVVELDAARIKARAQRIETNRNSVCGVCTSDISSPALPLQRPRSRMS